MKEKSTSSHIPDHKPGLAATGPFSGVIPDAVAFLAATLEQAGFEAYIVGGAVRDMCLKRPPTDWDLATTAPAKAIRFLFRDFSTFTLGHETVTVMLHSEPFQITPCRGPRNRIQGDLALRDLTINAMAYQISSGRILDPHGGLKDLKNRVIRGVPDPAKRFQEDPVRLLRTIRLSAELHFKVSHDTLKAMGPAAHLLSKTAPERIREELMKILVTDRPAHSFNLMVRTGLLKTFLPELLEGLLKRQNHYHRYTIFKHIMETVNHVEPDPLLRLTALLHDIAKPRVREKTDGAWHFHGHETASAVLAEEIMKRLRFSKQTIQKVTHLIRNHLIGYNSQWTDAAVRRLIKRVGTDSIAELLAFRKADIRAHGLQNRNSEILMELEKRIQQQMQMSHPTRIQDLAIDGHTVMAATGLPRGPEIGKLLSNLTEAVLRHPECNRKETLLKMLEKISR